jgi:hypothetical protein
MQDSPNSSNFEASPNKGHRFGPPLALVMHSWYASQNGETALRSVVPTG